MLRYRWPSEWRYVRFVVLLIPYSFCLTINEFVELQPVDDEAGDVDETHHADEPDDVVR